MKTFFLIAALGLATPAFAVMPFNQSSVTLPDGSQLVKNCNQRDVVTPYRVEIGAKSGWQAIELEARPHCPATLAAIDGKNMLHVVLGFSGRDRAATILDVGDSNHDLMEMKGMELQPGEAKTAERDGVQYRVTRLK